ncbi:unnamed protein product [Pleuronectes platessa]|uniref:Uncharacterized protein n=1 Tax=Pleuronectes platessa TaxID=8262 RepID=A0A9N7UL50_PLEPL|nr:unnamed protein product [Pleuronectes platessa]
MCSSMKLLILCFIALSSSVAKLHSPTSPLLNQLSNSPLKFRRLDNMITGTMLKVVLVLGCLLSLTLARPNHMRVARSDSSSSSESNERNQNGAGGITSAQWFQLILTILQQQTTAATTTAATTTATTPTTTLAKATVQHHYHNLFNQLSNSPLKFRRLDNMITGTMLKVVLVLGCLLSLTLARPNHMRVARSDSSSSSESNERNQNGAGGITSAQWFQIILTILQQQTTAATTTAATTTATTPTTTPAKATALLVLNNSENPTFRKMQTLGMKIVALAVIMMLVSSSLAKPAHVIEKRSSEENQRTSTTNTQSLLQLTQLLQLLQALRALIPAQ